MASPNTAVSSPAQGDESYLSSLTDLLVGMLFIFIIILMAFALNYRTAQQTSDEKASKAEDERQTWKQKATEAENEKLKAQIESMKAQDERLKAESEKSKAQNEKLKAEKRAQEAELARDYLTKSNEARRRLLLNIRDELDKRGIRVTVDEEQGVLHLPEELLFETARKDFKPAGRKAVEALAEVLAAVLPCYSRVQRQSDAECSHRFRLETVLIEGHTDKRPIKSQDFPSNWYLATARALETYTLIIGERPSLDALRNHRDEPLLGIGSYEARRPVARGDTEEDYAKNRRIDLRFIMAPPSLEEIPIIPEVRQQLENALP